MTREERKAWIMREIKAGGCSNDFYGRNLVSEKTETATQDSWRIEPMPENKVYDWCMDFRISKEEMSIVRKGHIPKTDDDPWFMYCDDETIRYYRSKTGICIFIADYEEDGEDFIITWLCINRLNRRLYCKDNAERDCSLFLALLVDEFGGDSSMHWNRFLDSFHDYKVESWDAEACKKKLESVEWEWRSEIHDILAEVFEDTVQRVMTGDIDHMHSFNGWCRRGQRGHRKTVFFDKEQPAYQPKDRGYTTEVEVVMADSIETGKKLNDEGLNTCVLAMSNRQGCLDEAKYGHFGQEKDILRRTNLFKHIAPFTEYAEEFSTSKSVQQYPFDRNFGGIFSPDVIVFRGRQKDGFPILKEFFELDFVSVAAMYNPDTVKGFIVPELIPGVKNKMRTIFRAALHGYDNAIVLGGLGCGELGNPPYHTAQLFLEVLNEPEFKNQFRKVVFAMKNRIHYVLFKFAVTKNCIKKTPSPLIVEELFASLYP